MDGCSGIGYGFLMSIDARVLRAMLRLARRREAAFEEAIAVCAGGAQRAVRASLGRLEAEGLVERRANHAPRLTMSGLAVAVAVALPVAGRRLTRDAPPTSRAA